jgi:hypothetical protein
MRVHSVLGGTGGRHIGRGCTLHCKLAVSVSVTLHRCAASPLHGCTTGLNGVQYPLVVALLGGHPSLALLGHLHSSDHISTLLVTHIHGAGVADWGCNMQDGGTVTAGNASPLADGAAAVVVARASTALRLGLPVLGRVRGFADANQESQWFSTSPALAIPKVRPDDVLPPMLALEVARVRQTEGDGRLRHVSLSVDLKLVGQSGWQAGKQSGSVRNREAVVR